MITRQQYMQDPDNLFETYYLQIAKIAGIVVPHVLYEQSREAYNNGDLLLNTIPVEIWDRHVFPYKAGIARANLKINGQNMWCLSDGVCALKVKIIKRIKQFRPRT